MAGCVLGAKRSMVADILKSVYLDDGTESTDTPPPDSPIGYWDYVQDPDSGAIEKTWVGVVPDDPGTPDIDESSSLYTLLNVKCEIRGIMEGGIRVAGTTQRFSEIYENVEWVKGTFAKDIDIAKGDKITNIRNQKGVLIWRNEEARGTGMAGGPTSFIVMGVTPVLDPFGNLIEQSVLAQRAEVQTAVA